MIEIRFLQTALDAAHAVARALADLPLEADAAASDRAADAAALAALAPLGIPIVSEESGASTPVDPREPWVSLDPLDGTRNFAARYPAYAFSAALVHHGAPLAGCVMDLTSGRCWTARRGAGAKFDDRVLATRRSTLAGIPSPLPGEPLPRLSAVERFRICGSSASELCHVADGSLTAFASIGRRVLWVHDIAAAIVIIEEAGGCVSDRSGSPLVLVPDVTTTYDVVAAADRELLDTLIRDLA